MVLERDIQAKFRDLCKACGWVPIKLMRTSIIGVPDMLVVTSNGCTVFVELKSATGKVSKIQTRVHALLARQQSLVLVGYEPYSLALSVAVYVGDYKSCRWLRNEQSNLLNSGCRKLTSRRR